MPLFCTVRMSRTLVCSMVCFWMDLRMSTKLSCKNGRKPKPLGGLICTCHLQRCKSEMHLLSIVTGLFRQTILYFCDMPVCPNLLMLSHKRQKMRKTKDRCRSKKGKLSQIIRRRLSRCMSCGQAMGLLGNRALIRTCASSLEETGVPGIGAALPLIEENGVSVLLFLVKENGGLWNSSCAFTLEQNGVSAFILEGDGMFLFFRRTEALE